MTPTPVTPGDAASMIRAATARAAAVQQLVIDGLVSGSTGELDSFERLLSIAALSTILRARVEHAAKTTPGLAELLERLDSHVGERVGLAVEIARERQPA